MSFQEEEEEDGDDEDGDSGEAASSSSPRPGGRGGGGGLSDESLWGLGWRKGILDPGGSHGHGCQQREERSGRATNESKNYVYQLLVREWEGECEGYRCKGILLVGQKVRVKYSSHLEMAKKWRNLFTGTQNQDPVVVARVTACSPQWPHLCFFVLNLGINLFSRWIRKSQLN